MCQSKAIYIVLVIVSVYAQRSGIIFSSPNASGGGAGGPGNAVIGIEEFLQSKTRQQKFVALHSQLYVRYISRDSRAGYIAFDMEKSCNLALQAKLDNITQLHHEAYIDSIQPRFAPSPPF